MVRSARISRPKAWARAWRARRYLSPVQARSPACTDRPPNRGRVLLACLGPRAVRAWEAGFEVRWPCDTATDSTPTERSQTCGNMGRTWAQALLSYGSQTIRAHTRGGQGGPNGAWQEKYKSTKRSNEEHCFRALVDEINAGFESRGVTERIPEPPLHADKTPVGGPPGNPWGAEWKRFYDRNMKPRLDASAAPPAADEDLWSLEDLLDQPLGSLLIGFSEEGSPLASMLDDSESTEDFAHDFAHDFRNALTAPEPSGAAMLDAGSSGTASTASPVAPPAALPAGYGSQKRPRDETLGRLRLHMEGLHEVLDEHLKAEPGCGHSQLRELEQEETEDLRELHRALTVVLYKCAHEHCHVSIHRATHPCRCLHRGGDLRPLQLSPVCRGGSHEHSLFDQIRDVVVRLVAKIYP